MPDKVRENRLRRAAKRQGKLIVKSKARDPRAVGYAGYMLVDLETATVAAGGLGADGLSLDEIETILTGGEPKPVPATVSMPNSRRRIPNRYDASIGRTVGTEKPFCTDP